MRLVFIAPLLLANALQGAGHAAILTGFAVMPADTFAAGPPSGAFLSGGVRSASPRFGAQPVQGVSSIWPDSDGWFWALVDNGYGTKQNSPDFLLRMYRLRPRFDEKRVDVGEFIQLRDPDMRVPFHIVNEGTRERVLTGADFDPESMVRMDDGTFWIGDEFGPFLLHIAADGRVLDRPVEAPGVRSPDNPFLGIPDAGETSKATVGRSRGFEGLAWHAPRRTLVALLEAGLVADAGRVSRALEFDPVAKVFTGTQWKVPFEQAGNSFTELVGVTPLAPAPDAGARLVTVERDGTQGAAARFKRVFYLDIPANREHPTDLESPVLDKHGVAGAGPLINLLSISDPDHLATATGTFTFPFVTTEALWPLSDGSIVLVNDNNYPAAGGRAPDQKDNTEFIRVKP